MIARFHGVILDAADTETLASFYGEVLGWPRVRTDGDWIDLDSGQGWLLSFQHAPDHQPPQWPDPSRPQQVHLDLEVDDMDAAEAKILALGALLLSTDEDGFRVYADPAGHPFCLVYDPEPAASA